MSLSISTSSKTKESPFKEGAEDVFNAISDKVEQVYKKARPLGSISTSEKSGYVSIFSPMPTTNRHFVQFKEALQDYDFALAKKLLLQNLKMLKPTITPRYADVYKEDLEEQTGDVESICFLSGRSWDKKNETGLDVDQGENCVESVHGKERILYTEGVGPCIAVVARGFDKKGKLIAIGLAHCDGIRQENVTEMLEKIKLKKAVSIELFSIGGTKGSAKVADSTMDGISQELEEFSGCEITKHQCYLDPFKIDDEDLDKHQPLEPACNTVRFCLSAAIDIEGNIFAHMDSLAHTFNEAVMTALTQFQASEFDQLEEKLEQDSKLKEDLFALMGRIYLARSI